MEKYVVALVTVPSKEVGMGIAKALLEAKLAACVNILPSISSLYTWEGEICEDEEVLLTIKTKAELFEKMFIPAIQELHPYKVPEIIALPIVIGAKNYLEWIDEVTL